MDIIAAREKLAGRVGFWASALGLVGHDFDYSINVTPRSVAITAGSPWLGIHESVAFDTLAELPPEAIDPTLAAFRGAAELRIPESEEEVY